MHDFATFYNQYIIEGIIQLETPLHIGGGDSSVYGTDNSVVKTVDGSPYIPGSSLKGVLRTYLERLAQSGSLQAEGYKKPCIFGETMCLSELDKKEKRLELKQEIGEENFNQYLSEQSCPICHLFGNQLRAAKVKITDATVHRNWIGKYDIREGVGIDRDTGTATQKMKYDFEVVPAGTQFKLKMIADNLSEVEVKWLMIAINSLIQGRILLGGKTARGLGYVSGKDWFVTKVEPQQLVTLLIKKEEQKIPFETFIQEMR